MQSPAVIGQNIRARPGVDRRLSAFRIAFAGVGLHHELARCSRDGWRDHRHPPRSGPPLGYGTPMGRVEGYGSAETELTVPMSGWLAVAPERIHNRAACLRMEQEIIAPSQSWKPAIPLSTVHESRA